MNDLLENELSARNSQKQRIVNLWEKNGLLSKFGVEDKNDQLDFALVLENQRLSGDMDFNRKAIPIAVNVWNSLILNSIASVQPLSNRDDCYYHLEYGKEVSMAKTHIKVKNYKYKAIWNMDTTDIKPMFGMDVEAELSALMSSEIALEINRRGINTIMSYAGLNSSYDFYGKRSWSERAEQLHAEIKSISEEVGTRNNRGSANWIVTSPEIAHLIVDDDEEFTGSLFVNKVGNIDNLEIYKDALFPANRMLFGYKGNHPYDSGYFYCPFTMINKSPVTLDPDSFTPRQGLYAEEYHGLRDGGENFYATLTIPGFPL